MKILTEKEEQKRPKGYKGFLYIKCASCGKVKDFCAKEPVNQIQCECRSYTELKKLVRLYINCECGMRTRYKTNMTDKMFDVNCLYCGAPVAVEKNIKKMLYAPIRN